MPDGPISTADAPTPAGHYAQAVVHQGTVYISGQLPIDPRVGPPRSGEPLPDVEQQTKQAIANLFAILAAAGTSPEHVLRCTVYVSSVDHWPQVNRTYAECFARHGHARPARTVVPTGPLHYGYDIEIDAIAALPPAIAGHLD